MPGVGFHASAVGTDARAEFVRTRVVYNQAIPLQFIADLPPGSFACTVASTRPTGPLVTAQLFTPNLGRHCAVSKL